MRYGKTAIISLVTLLFLVYATPQQVAAQKSKNFVIEQLSAGGVSVGMTVGEAKKAWSGFTFGRTRDGEFSGLVGVSDGATRIASLHTDESGELNLDTPIVDSAKITAIEVWDPRFETKKGLHPGMSLQAADKLYRGIFEIERSPIEFREYARFRDQPEDIDVRVAGKTGDAGSGYKKDFRGVAVAQTFNPDAYVLNITIQKRKNKYEPPEFDSATTELPGDCKALPSDDGGHVTRLCTSVGDYRINYFDAATLLQFSAEKTDGKFSTVITQTPLDFESGTHSIDWQLADGKPFAVLMKKGDSILVRGLKGFGAMDTTLDGTGKYAMDQAREYADNAYMNILYPPVRIDIPVASGKKEVEGYLENPRDRMRYVVKLNAGQHLKVEVKSVSSKAEGAAMTGVVIFPNGAADGTIGGVVFDDVLTESGDYTIEVAQRLATDGRDIKFVLVLDTTDN